MKKPYENYKNALDELKLHSNFRSLTPLKIEGKYVFQEGKKLLNLSSNDYLGISCRNDIKRAFFDTYNDAISVPSARLLCANNDVYYELEDFLKTALKKEASLLFNSGYHANVGIYSSLAKKGDVVFCDKLNHASIIDGIRLGGADLIPFKHADYEDLENKLKKYRTKYKNAIIASESLFSMDGDFSNINLLVELKEHHSAILVVDEAHSFGVYGNGLGYAHQCGALEGVDLIMATFGKAVGSYGAFCAGDRVLIEYLTNYARSFIFSTVFPQISAAYAHFVLKNYILKDTKLQDNLLCLKDFMHSELKDFNILGSSYILPVVLGQNELALEASKYLREKGFYCLPVRYPTVAKNTARLRISLNSAMTHSELSALAQALYEIPKISNTNSALQEG